MKRIAIVSNGYAWFPIEPGPSRFYYIATTFAHAGWSVEIITTSFQHFKKKPRDKNAIYAEKYPFKITFVETPPYKKNIDIQLRVRREMEYVQKGQSNKNYAQLSNILEELEKMLNSKNLKLCYPRMIVDSWDFTDELGLELLDLAELYKRWK